MNRRSTIGLSLLEVLISIILLVTTLWAVQTAYVGLMRGSGKNEARQKALATAETLLLEWQEKLKDQAYWDSPDLVEGIDRGYFYRVEMSSPLDDPLSNGTLNFRVMTLSVYYPDPRRTAKRDLSTPSVPLVVRLTSCVSK